MIEEGRPPMQVTETLNEGLKRGYTITVTAAELDAKVQEKLIEAQPEVEIKGFRKGKVPLAILKKQFGSRILGDAMQEAIDAAMKDHFDKTGDRPALQPEVKMVGGENWKEGGTSEEAYFTGIPAGNYLISFTGIREPGLYKRLENFDVNVVYDVSFFRNVIFCILLVLGMAVIQYMIFVHYDKKRWYNSSYSKYNYED